MKHGADVVFIERPFPVGSRGLPGWDVRLVSRDAHDRQHGNQLVGSSGFHARIFYAQPYGSLDGYGEDTPEGERDRYTYFTQGWHRGGRRWGAAATVTQAQEAVAKWARRRFYVEG